MPESLEEFFSNGARDWETIKQMNGWEIQREDVIVTFKLSARDGERYIVRLVCDHYPDHPPAVSFINERGEKNDVRAWPRGNNVFHNDYVKIPPVSFICAPLTAEGVQHHPNWSNVWKSQGCSLMDVFNFLHALLNDPKYGYEGRQQ